MTARQLAAIYKRNGAVITNRDGTTRVMSRLEVSRARRFIRRTPKRLAWFAEHEYQRLHHVAAVLTVAEASGVAA